MILLAALSVIYLGPVGGQTVPDAVLESQKQLVTTAANALATAADRRVDELRDLAAEYQQDPAHNLAKLPAAIGNGAEPTWRGIAVLDPGRRLAITQGDQVPVERVPSALTAPVRVPFAAPDGARLLLAVPLFDGRTLVGLTGLTIRPLRLDANSHQSILVVVGADATLSQGAARRPDGSAPAALAQKAVRALGRGDVTSITGSANPGTPVPGTDTAPVATAAKAGRLNVFVVSVVDAPTINAAARWDGVPPAVVLLVLGLAAFLLVRFALVRPVLRLLDHAKAVACGEPGRLTRRPYLTELQRIGRGLERPRIPVQRGATRTVSSRGGIPGALVVVGAALAVVMWSGAVVVVFSRPTIDLPGQLVADAQNQVEAAASSFRSVLESGVAQLADVVRRNPDKKPQQLTPALRELTADGSRYRSVYVADVNGRVVVSHGKEPLRGRGKLPDRDGVHLDSANGRVPTIFAQARLSSTHVLVGEFDIRQLTSLLRRADGRVRLVNAQLRTMLDTDGFLAFQQLSATGIRRAAGGAVNGRASAAVTPVHGVSSLVAAAPLAVGTAGEPPWAVVAERSVSHFSLPVNDVQRGAWMVGITGLCIALLLGGWLYFLVLQPLRAVAAAADRLAGGDVDTVISPARQDEVGSIAVCLDICRQARVHGTARLAGAVRLRGADANQTAVLPRIPAQRRHARRGQPALVRRRP